MKESEDGERRGGPPRVAVALMAWMFPDGGRYTTLGDLQEAYDYVSTRESRRRAGLWYWGQVLRSVGPYLMDATQRNVATMYRNYFKIAVRNLRRQFGYTFINVFGLALGMACCLLIVLFVQHEGRYDDFHEKGDRIFRMVNDVTLPSGLTRTGYVPLPHGPLLEEEIASIESIVRLIPSNAGLVLQREERRFEEHSFLYADSGFFHVFTFPLRRGDAATALREPFSAVLTPATAAKYFGDADPVGKPLVANGEFTFTVTGVLEHVPETSHLQFDGLFSIESARRMDAAYFQDRLNLAYATYVLAKPGIDGGLLRTGANEVFERHFGEGYRAANIGYTVDFEALPDVYLKSDRGGLGRKGSLQNLYVFSLIALLTLLIACVNFMNLATARSVERAREIGIRRVVGSLRIQLVAQFLCESVFMALLALMVACVLAAAAVPVFNSLAATSITLADLLTPGMAVFVVGGTIAVGVFAGSYPAFVLSGFRPGAVLKGRHSTSRHGVILRKSLAVIQFTISIVLLCGTGVIYRQVQYMSDERLGFRADELLVIDFQADADVQKRIEAVKAELLQIPGVAGAAASNAVPGRPSYSALSYVETADGSEREMMIRAYPVDFDFLSEFGIDVVAGRAFSAGMATDSTEAYVINEAARVAMGYPSAAAAIGASFRQWSREGRIIGVVSDFHVSSLRNPIGPLSFAVYPGQARYLTLRLAGADFSSTIDAVEKRWTRVVPHRPLSYSFLDDSFQRLYDAEIRFGKIVGTFTFLSILVACLGLLGLASFSAVQRSKEIGVRKVLGATVAQIVVLLSGDVVRLMAYAFVLAAPIAYLVMEGWLQAFAFRIDPPIGVFILAGLAPLLAALLTVACQSIRAATVNPVHTLRSE